MKNKNKKLIIVVASLFLVIGVSFAYFTVSVLLDGKGASTSGTTATLGSSELKVEGSLSFSDLDIYPGHQNVSSIKVSATGENELIPYHVIWEGENTLNTTLKYYVYKVEQEVEVKATCEKKNGIKDGAKTYYEECSISNESELGSIISSGEIKTGETKKRIITDEFITSSKEGEEVYYYVILEYPNNNENQNRDIGGRFKGEVTVEINDTTPDISIIGAYIEENGSYKEVSEIPREGYELNEEKSSCNNNAKLGWDKENSRIYVEKLNKSGTECTLYYDKYVSAKDTILANSKVNEGIPNFNRVATTDEGIYKAEDDWGESYYFRGAVENNYVKFAGYYWRIIRINGDGSIRLIYNGESTVTTGDSTQISTSTYNSSYNDNAYVGYMYGSTRASSYAATHANNNPSTIKGVLDNWYTENLANKDNPNKNYEKYISKEAGFCNDRRIAGANETFWNGDTKRGYGTNTTAYAPFSRFLTTSGSWASTQNPTLKCSQLSSDMFTPTGSSKGNKKLSNPVGLITADEVVFAGGKGGTNNQSYYLYTGQNYWTMSPYGFNDGYARVFCVASNGFLGYSVVYYTWGVRPVINIDSDVTISSGDGTSSNPFIIS